MKTNSTIVQTTGILKEKLQKGIRQTKDMTAGKTPWKSYVLYICVSVRARPRVRMYVCVCVCKGGCMGAGLCLRACVA